MNLLMVYCCGSVVISVLCMTLVHASVDNVRIVPPFIQVKMRADVYLQCQYDISDKGTVENIIVHWYMQDDDSTPRGLFTAMHRRWENMQSSLDDTAPDDDYMSPNHLGMGWLMYSHNLTILSVNDLDGRQYFCTVTVERASTETEHIVSTYGEIVVEVADDLPPEETEETCGTVDSRFPIHPDDSLSRIVGGFEANPHSLPWQVGLQNSGRYTICGGTLISPIWVISAAHCFKPTHPQLKYIIAGDHDRGVTDDDTEQTRTIAEKVIHPEYRFCYPKMCVHADIVLLRVDVPFEITAYVKPACVAEFDAETDERCIVSGWGYMQPGSNIAHKLQMAWLPIISRRRCYDMMGHAYYNGTTMICSALRDGGRDACQGDSGGPLVCQSSWQSDKWYLNGLVSWGYECGKQGEAGVYTRITAFRAWIGEVINRNSLTETDSSAATTPNSSSEMDADPENLPKALNRVLEDDSKPLDPENDKPLNHDNNLQTPLSPPNVKQVVLKNSSKLPVTRYQTLEDDDKHLTAENNLPLTVGDHLTGSKPSPNISLKASPKPAPKPSRRPSSKPSPKLSPKPSPKSSLTPSSTKEVKMAVMENSSKRTLVPVEVKFNTAIFVVSGVVIMILLTSVVLVVVHKVSRSRDHKSSPLARLPVPKTA